MSECSSEKCSRMTIFMIGYHIPYERYKGRWSLQLRWDYYLKRISSLLTSISPSLVDRQLIACSISPAIRWSVAREGEEVESREERNREEERQEGVSSEINASITPLRSVSSVIEIVSFLFSVKIIVVEWISYYLSVESVNPQWSESNEKEEGKTVFNQSSLLSSRP